MSSHPASQGWPLHQRDFHAMMRRLRDDYTHNVRHELRRRQFAMTPGEARRRKHHRALMRRFRAAARQA